MRADPNRSASNRMLPTLLPPPPPPPKADRAANAAVGLPVLLLLLLDSRRRARRTGVVGEAERSEMERLKLSASPLLLMMWSAAADGGDFVCIMPASSNTSGIVTFSSV